MKKSISAALLMILAVGASAQVPPSSGTVSVMITRALLPGQFSVSSTTKVRFTRGNLKYQASTNTWDFHEYQKDRIGGAPGNNTAAADRPTQEDWIDLFYWGTSGWSNNGTIPGYQPWECAYENTTGNFYGPPHPNGLVGEYARSDWGANMSRNGNVFRVLTKDEWNYLINGRTNHGNLWGLGNLLGQNGCFILPDDWDWNVVDPGGTLRAAAGFVWSSSCKADFNSCNNIADVDDGDGVDEGQVLWAAMEDAGAVFLPTSPVRWGTSVSSETETSGRYWSSTSVNSTHAYIFYFQNDKVDPNYSIYKYRGRTVRLVQEIVTE